METRTQQNKHLEAAHAEYLPDNEVLVTTIGGMPETDPMNPDFGKQYDPTRVVMDAAGVQFSGETEAITPQRKGGKDQWVPWDDQRRARRSVSDANRNKS